MVPSIEKLLDPMRDESELVKKNANVQKIVNHVVIMKCFMIKKIELDLWRTKLKNTPASSLERELCKMESSSTRY